MFSEKEYIKAIGIISCYLNCDEMSTEEFNDSIVVINNLINEHFELVKEYETYKKINRFEKECEKFYCKENYFNIIIKALCDCKDKELQDNAVHCLAYLKLQLDNPPLKLEELKEETWVWDSEYNEWCYIDFIAGEYIHRKYIDDCISDGEFEENRFYRREVNKNGII